jgi:FKBP-type peptidyl-prolyl cis-trans isomerase
MKPAKGLKVKDITLGSGPATKVGDDVLVEFECHLNRGDLLYSSKEQGAVKLRIGQRNTVIGIEQGVIGMRIGGTRDVRVPAHLAHMEQRFFPNLSTDSMLRYSLRLRSIDNATQII